MLRRKCDKNDISDDWLTYRVSNEFVDDHVQYSIQLMNEKNHFFQSLSANSIQIEEL